MVWYYTEKSVYLASHHNMQLTLNVLSKQTQCKLQDIKL